MEAIIAAHIWAILHTAPTKAPEFTLKPPVVELAGSQGEELPSSHVLGSPHVIKESQTPAPPAPVETVSGDSGYVATCPDGTPAQGSCETPEGSK